MRLIDCSILTILNDLSIPDEKIQSIKNKYSGLKASFEATYKKILDYEIVLPNKKIKDIVQVRASGVKYILGGSNFSLYEGGGMIWSIYCYGLEIDDRDIQNTAICLLEKAEINYKSKGSSDCSAYSDVLGAVYLYYNFFKSTGNEEYFYRYRKYLNIFKKEIDSCLDWDYLTGISGAIHLLSNIYKEQQDDCLKEIILLGVEKLEYLLMKETPDSMGIAHGSTGVAVAFADIFEITKKDQYMEKSFQLLLNEGDVEAIENKSWCYGLSGILLAYANILNRAGQRFKQYGLINERFHIFLAEFMKLPSRNNLCLCHGSSGELETLNELLSKYSDLLLEKEFKSIIEKITERTKILPEINGNSLGIPLDLPLDTFMLGASGVAYTQLRLVNPSFLHWSCWM
ncbi:lanthionine synthetase LanC family protein [Enterococcus rivorum]|uniref:lanthionine synthetase LanC family protein n=1 Tax=Enterococcus rivorum TaxID=762845 RepID=UPI00362CF975